MSAFAELRDFALDTIPALLLEAGGQMDKERMHARVERLFIRGRPWHDELTRIQKGGCSVKRNAIAWAMARLVMDGVLCPSLGQPTVHLAGLTHEPLRNTRAPVPSTEPTYEARIKARALERARSCRSRARREGVPFDESFVISAGEQVERQGFRCAATGIPFDLDEIGEGAGASHFAPSPDRIVPARGYVPGNIRWVLWMVNRAKSRMTEEQFRRMCRAYRGERIGRGGSHPKPQPPMNLRCQPGDEQAGWVLAPAVIQPLVHLLGNPIHTTSSSTPRFCISYDRHLRCRRRASAIQFPRAINRICGRSATGPKPPPTAAANAFQPVNMRLESHRKSST